MARVTQACLPLDWESVESCPDLDRVRLALESRRWGRKDPADSADPEADWGKKTRKWTDAKGQVHEEATKWFGYKGHLLVDTRHELPLARRVTKASRPDAEKVREMIRDEGHKPFL